MLNGKRVVLIVDDDPEPRQLLDDFLTSSGYTTRLASSAIDAIGKLDSSVDVVVTDYQMPIMNGGDLLSIVRKKFPNLPVIGISGFRFADRDMVSKLFDAFIFKPFRMADFLRSVDGAVLQMAESPA